MVWSIEPDSSHAGTYITETGKLYIDKDEDQASFIVLAKSKMDGGIAGHCIVTIDTGN